MSAAAGERGSRVDLTPEEKRALDGADRVAWLPLAATVIVGPPREPDEPASVIIEWEPGRVERPVPGSTLWRAAVGREVRRLEEEAAGAPEELLADRLSRAAERWPDIDTWWAWLRTGWLAPPTRPRG